MKTYLIVPAKIIRDSNLKAGPRMNLSATAALTNGKFPIEKMSVLRVLIVQLSSDLLSKRPSVRELRLTACRFEKYSSIHSFENHISPISIEMYYSYLERNYDRHQLG